MGVSCVQFHVMALSVSHFMVRYEHPGALGFCPTNRRLLNRRLYEPALEPLSGGNQRRTKVRLRLRIAALTLLATRVPNRALLAP